MATVEFSSQGPSEKKEGVNNHFLGCIAIMAAAVTSGFAGVYFEAVLKGARCVMSSQLFCDRHSDPNVLPHSLSTFFVCLVFAGRACGLEIFNWVCLVWFLHSYILTLKMGKGFQHTVISMDTTLSSFWSFLFRP